MGTIAGHSFVESSTGRRCAAYSMSTFGTCQALWQHVRTCREDDIGVAFGFAHSGTPSANEYAEIRAEVEREEASIWQAVVDAASAGSR